MSVAAVLAPAPRPIGHAASDACHDIDVVARWLGVAVLGGGAGMAAAALRGDGSAVNTFLFMHLGVPHAPAAAIERTTACVCLLLSLGGVAWRRWALLIPAMAWPLLEASARVHVQGEGFSELALLAHAARYVAPLALMALFIARERNAPIRANLRTTVEWLLRIATAAVFFAHGIECLQGNPVFIDLIISSARNLCGVRVTEHSTTVALELIGLADIAVAGAMLTCLHRAVLAWAAGWAAVAALSRVTANGPGALPDVLVRLSYVCCPAALWWRQPPRDILP